MKNDFVKLKNVDELKAITKKCRINQSKETVKQKQKLVKLA